MEQHAIFNNYEIFQQIIWTYEGTQTCTFKRLALAKQKQNPKVPLDIYIQGEKSRKDTQISGNNLNNWNISKSKNITVEIQYWSPELFLRWHNVSKEELSVSLVTQSAWTKFFYYVSPEQVVKLNEVSYLVSPEQGVKLGEVSYPHLVFPEQVVKLNEVST